MANNAITPAVLRVTEAAQYLACSERTIWNLIKSEKIPAVRFGKILRIERADLDDFIAAAKGSK
jgi:excisionase family DNA binding protein